MDLLGAVRELGTAWLVLGSGIGLGGSEEL